VLGVEDCYDGDGPIGEVVVSTPGPVWCGACGSPAWVNDRHAVELVDLPAFSTS